MRVRQSLFNISLLNGVILSGVISTIAISTQPAFACSGSGLDPGWSDCYQREQQEQHQREINNEVIRQQQQQQQQQQQRQQQRSGRWYSSFTALVWGEENGIPTFAWGTKYLTEEEAVNAAMTSCLSHNAQNCRLAFSFANGYLVIFKDDNGAFYANSAATQQEAVQSARGACEAANGVNCRIEKVIESKPWFQ